MRLPREIDLQVLEIFVATVELGGMTAAAAQVRTTQSAVSQTIARLELGIGTTLFDRTLRPLALTPAGRALYDRAARLLVSARAMVDEVRDGANRPLTQITIGMSESLATLLTTPMLRFHGARADHWRVRSGISLNQQQEFLTRRFDMLITGSSLLEKHEGIDHHDVLDDPFVLVFPGDYQGSLDPADACGQLPFLRYSLDTGMGQRIESQLTRMKLRVPNAMEVDSIHQQMNTVAEGIGWSIASLLCLAAVPWLIDRLRIEPLRRGRFARRVQVVSRRDEIGDLAADIAALARDVVRDESLPPVLKQIPWARELVRWP